MASTAQIGQLDRRIEIQQATTTTDAYGQSIDTWTTLACCWAKVENPLAGNREKVFGDVETSVTRAMITIRYRDGITERHSVLYNGDYYDIMNIHQIGRRAYLLLICEKRV